MVFRITLVHKTKTYIDIHKCNGRRLVLTSHTFRLFLYNMPLAHRSLDPECIHLQRTNMTL